MLLLLWRGNDWLRGAALIARRLCEQALAGNQRQIGVAIEHFSVSRISKDGLEDFLVLGDLLNGLADQIRGEPPRHAQIQPRPCVRRRS